MKLPVTIDMRKHGAKEFVQKIIDLYGKSRNINQIGLEVNCEDESGKKFQVLQFNSSRHIVTIGSVTE